MNAIKKPPQIIDEAEALLQQGHAQEAINSLLDLAEKRPELIRVHMILGRSYFQLKQYQTSNDCFNKVLSLDPRHRNAHRLLSKAWCEQEQFDLAITNAKLLQKELIDLPWPTLILAEAYLAANKNQHALNEISVFLNKHPEDLDAVKCKFTALNKLNQQRNAEKFLQQNLKFHDAPWIRDQLIQLNLHANPAVAKEHLEYCLINYPALSNFIVNMAKLNEIEGKHDEAIKLLKNAYLKFESANIGLQLLLIYIKTKQFEQAVAFQKDLILKFPDNTWVLIHSIQLLLEIDQLTQAESYLKHLQNTHPDHLAFYRYSANLYIQLGQYIKAISLFEQGKNHHGDNPQYWAEYLQLSLRCYQPLYFYKAKKISLKKFPTNIIVIRVLANIHLNTGHYSEAIKLLNQCKPKGIKQVSEVQGLIAKVQLHDMSLKNAFERYSYAIALHPDNPHHYKSRAHSAVLSPYHQQARRDFRIAQTLSLQKTGKNNYALGDVYGQILNEMQSNPHALKSLEKVFDTPSLPAFITLLQQEPHYTPAHISFLMYMRNKGAFTKKDVSKQISKIPKNIFQFWDTETRPQDIAYLTSSWKNNHPDWNYQCVNETQALKFLASNFNKTVVTAFIQSPQAAMKSDLFRLAVLYKYGGVYADADDLSLKSLDSLLSSGKSLYLYQEYVGSMGNNFIAVAKNHPLIRSALEEAVTNVLENSWDYVWLATGPALITRHFSRFLISMAFDQQPSEDDCHILTLAELHEFSLIHCEVDYKKTEQHWVKAKVI